MLTSCSSFLMTFGLIGLVVSNDYQDFLICPERHSQGSLVNRTIDCGPNGLINILWARIASLGLPAACMEDYDDTVALITNDLFSTCKVDLPFSACHTRRMCTVVRSMADTFIASCQSRGRIGQESDVLYVRYICETTQFDRRSTVLIPSTGYVTGDVIDILSRGFPQNSPSPSPSHRVYCKISSALETNQDIELTVRTKVAKYGVQTNIGSAFESIDLETDSSSDSSLLRYVGIPIQIRNNEYRSSGKQWTLWFYRDFEIDGGQFWIQLEAITTSNNSMPLNMTCENQMLITTTMETNPGHVQSSDGLLIVLELAGTALLILSELW